MASVFPVLVNFWQNIFDSGNVIGNIDFSMLHTFQFLTNELKFHRKTQYQ